MSEFNISNLRPLQTLNGKAKLGGSSKGTGVKRTAWQFRMKSRMVEPDAIEGQEKPEGLVREDVFFFSRPTYDKLGLTEKALAIYQDPQNKQIIAFAAVPNDHPAAIALKGRKDKKKGLNFRSSNLEEMLQEAGWMNEIVEGKATSLYFTLKEEAEVAGIKYYSLVKGDVVESNEKDEGAEEEETEEAVGKVEEANATQASNMTSEKDILDM